MTSDSIASLLYLALLGAAILAYYIAANRHDLGRTLRMGVLWGLIFVGTIAAAGLWRDVQDQIVPNRALTIEGDSLSVPQSFDGHYRMQLGINGTPVNFIVDTGASDMVLSRRDAARAGIDPDGLAYLGRAQTANGTVPLARVTLDRVSLAGEVERNVAASVNGGDMDGSLLGMSYLQRFGRIEIADGTLTLTP